MEAERLLVKKQFDKGLQGAKIVRVLKPFGIKKDFVYKTIQRLRETGSIKDRPRSGRPRSIRVPARIKRIREKFRRNPQRSVRELAREEAVPRESMRELVNCDLGFRPYRKRKVAGLTQKQKEKRKARCKILKKRHAGLSLKKIIFSDEKLFMMEQCHNAKNNVVYAASFEAIPRELLSVPRYQNKNSIMVWGGVSERGKLPLVFIEKGVKINSEYYQKEILEPVLKPEAQKLYPNGDWIFQQDSAPAHASKVNQAWCQANCPKFISSNEWPPSSPDLNPLDFCIWGTLESKVNKKQHHNFESMKRALVREWDKLSMDVVRAAIKSWPDRLQAVVDAEGGRFE